MDLIKCLSLYNSWWLGQNKKYNEKNKWRLFKNDSCYRNSIIVYQIWKSNNGKAIIAITNIIDKTIINNRIINIWKALVKCKVIKIRAFMDK